MNLRIDIDFDAIHFRITLLVIGGIYQYFIVYFIQTGNIFDFFLNHGLRFFVKYPHGFFNVFNGTCIMEIIELKDDLRENYIESIQLNTDISVWPE